LTHYLKEFAMANKHYHIALMENEKRAREFLRLSRK
jgi:hypothetical protein